MTIGEAFKNAYKGGLEVLVSFVKNNGAEREMTVKRIHDVEARCTGNGSSWPISSDQMRVIELGPCGPQWRTINLDRINYFTVNNPAAGSF